MVTIGKSKKGVALVEVIVAILIFAIVIIGGSFLFASGRNQINLRERYRVAVQLAAGKLEELKAGNYYDIEEGQTPSQTEESLSLEDLSYSRSIDTEDVGLYKKVKVAVHWEQMECVPTIVEGW